MSDNQFEYEFDESTMELIREIAEAENNSMNQQLLKMMAVYTTTSLISKSEKLQQSLTEATQET